MNFSRRVMSVMGAVVVACGVCRGQDAAPPDGKPVAPERDGAQPEVLQPEAVQDAPRGDPAAREVLEKASKAIAEATSLSFTSKTRYTGFLQGISYATDATVRMTKEFGAKQWRLRAIGSGSKKADQPAQSFDVLWEPSGVSWLDDAAKKLMVRPKGQARAVQVQMAWSSFLNQFDEPTPFTKELGAESIELEGTEEIGGVSCDIVAVRAKGKSKGLTKFWIGSEDHVPRKMERTSESASYGSSTIVELMDVKLNEPIAAAQMTLEAPDGYTKDSTVTAKPAPPPPPAVPAAATPAEGAGEGTEAHSSEAAGATHDGSTPVVAPSQPQRTPAPEFELAAGDGTKVALSMLRGKPVLLFFWGTWSLPSRGADPAVQAMHEKFGGAGLKVLALAVREKTPEAAHKFISEAGHSYTSLNGADAVAKLYQVTVYPTFVVVDADGNIASKIEGWRKDETGPKLADEIGKLLPNVPNESVLAPEANDRTKAEKTGTGDDVAQPK